MAETLTKTGRVPGLEMITPRDKLYTESARFLTGFPDASRDFLRKGMWGKILYGPNAQYPVGFSTLGSADESVAATNAFPEFAMVWQDGDQSDVRWSNTISVVCPSYANFTAKTQLFIPTGLVAGDPLVVEVNGGTIAGDYGKLKEAGATTGNIWMGTALHVGTDWLTFRTITPIARA